jgi:hypothetical protein
VAEDDGEARAPERREERGAREQRVQRVRRVPVPRLELRRRRLLELRLGLGSGFGLGVAAGVGAGAAEEFCLGVVEAWAASRAAAVVESARVNHVGRRERGGVELAGASGVDAGGDGGGDWKPIRRPRKIGLDRARRADCALDCAYRDESGAYKKGKTRVKAIDVPSRVYDAFTASELEGGECGGRARQRQTPGAPKTTRSLWRGEGDIDALSVDSPGVGNTALWAPPDAHP